MGMIVMSLQDYYLLVLNPPPSRGRQEEDREKEGRGQGKGRESAGGKKWKAGESKSFCSGRVTNQMLHWSHVFSSRLTYNCRKKFIQSLMQRFSELTWTIVFVVHWTFFFHRCCEGEFLVFLLEGAHANEQNSGPYPTPVFVHFWVLCL